MAVEQAGAGEGSATPDAGITLEDFAADAFGDVTETPSSSGESQPVATSDAAGTPPGERQQATSEAQPKAPEGSDKDARAGTTPADAAKSQPDKGAPTTNEADSDPLATATPFTYPVNGQDKTFEGIKVLGDAGAIITSEALPLLAQKLSDAERFHATSREQYDQIKDFERLTEWKGQGPDGKEQTLTGREGAVALHTENEQLKASLTVLASVLRPNAQGAYPILEKLVGVDPRTNTIIALPDVLEELIERSNNAEFRAGVDVRERFAATTRPQATTSGRSEAPATALDPVRLKEQAPRIIDQAAQESGVDPKLLTPEDRQFLAEQFPRYVRAVTEDERRNDPNLRNTQHITDRDFAQLVARQANHRKELAKTAEAATSASKENAARLAAAARGTRTTSTSSQAPSPKQPTPAANRVSDAEKLWELRENLAGGKFSR